jgi:hypothetical protein
MGRAHVRDCYGVRPKLSSCLAGVMSRFSAFRGQKGARPTATLAFLAFLVMWFV